MTIELRSRPVELRAEGRQLSGVVMPYGEIAVATFGPERFEPGAFGEGRASDVKLNLQHQRSVLLTRTGAGLELIDGPDALRMVATLPDVTAARDAVGLVKAGVLRGLSVEFSALRERLQDGVRVIERALLSAIGVVDDGAFPGATVEARRRGGGRIGLITTFIPKGRTVSCGCQRGSCSKVNFGKDAFKGALSDRNKQVLAIKGEYKDTLGARSRNTLRMVDEDDALTVEIDLPDTEAGRDLLAQAKAAPVVVRPYFNQDESEFEERDGVATYSALALRALIVGSTDSDEGWPEATVDDTPADEAPQPRPRRRRLIL